ncbi:MAG: response regulator [Chthoniobacteraceae bacterium]
MSSPIPASLTPPAAALNRRILIIDDTPAIHEDFRKILAGQPPANTGLDDLMASVLGTVKTVQASRPEFDLESAFQGEQGLEMVKQAAADQRQYAMAFVDVRMPPGWDGVETIQQLWRQDPDLQVVICTAFSDYSWDEMVSKLGHSDQLLILKKPFDQVEVLQLACSMTKKWSLARQAATKVGELDRLVQERTSALRGLTDTLAIEVAERAQAEERFSKAFNFSPMPMAIVRSAELSCVDANRSFLKAVGCQRRDEVVGSILEALGIHLDEALRSALSVGRALVGRECELSARGAQRRAARLWSEAFELGGQSHALIVVEDISERAALESQLRQTQKMQSVGHLAAGIAHDFNNVLTVIQGHATLRLAGANLEAPIAKSFRDMNEAAMRAASLTRQLLAFSSQQVMQPQVVRLNSVVSNLGSMLRRLIPESIAIDVRQSEQLPPVHADVCNLEQVILNLAVNARDAMPESGRLTITSEAVVVSREHAARRTEAREGNFVRLTVSDSGTGMDSETQRRIFEPFFTTKEFGKGTGMGLATVHGIVNQHEGWIEVVSAPGEGTTFQIYLPVTDLDEPGAVAEVSTVAHLPRSSKTILVVEDDPTVRSLAETVLADAGYRVLAAEDGNAAVALWREFQGPIDLLVTDMVMPGGLSGKEVAERITIDRPSVKVIFSSGYSTDLFGGRIDLPAGHDYLPKPYRSQDLLNAVHRLLSFDGSASADSRCEAA